MASQKPSTPKGTRDFSPDEMMRRNFIFDTIRSVFKKYGYQPIETPAMENMSTLMGKYGEEGDKLIFKVLNSGNFWESVRGSDFGNEYWDNLVKQEELKLTPKEERSVEQNRELERLLGYFTGIQKLVNSRLVNKLSEKALRYDLTVPFARYVVQHQNEITFPFKRYQIQPVWRADRPQKGRYREFYQCDADVIGSTSLINEVELVQMVDEVFTRLNVPVTVKFNNRKLLQGLAESVGVTERFLEYVSVIDQLDKIGREGVIQELERRHLPTEKMSVIIHSAQDILSERNLGSLESIRPFLLHDFGQTEIGKKGAEELLEVIDRLKSIGLKTARLDFDCTLARGLNYYTGAIFEVKANTGTLTSSICGGGRYDDLTGIFGLPNVSGVGISFGIDRIFDVLNEVGYPEDVTAKEGTRVLFANFGGDDEKYSLKLLKQVRDAGISAEIYLDAVKMGKQFKYADDKKIPFVAIIGENERKTNSITLKNMQSGEQFAVGFAELLEMIK